MTIDYAIIGLGKSGFACVEYLAAQGAALVVMDTRENPPYLAQLKARYPEVDVVLNRLDESALLQANERVLSPGISLQHPVLQRCLLQGKSFINDVTLFVRQAKAPVVAITGSNGKSTVVKLVEHICQASGVSVIIGGNIGTPVCDLLALKTPVFYVLELSSFQLMTCGRLDAHAAVVLNITPDHLDWHNNFDEYRDAKLSIYQGCHYAVDMMCLWHDQPRLATINQHDRFYSMDGMLFHNEQAIVSAQLLPYPGFHFVENVLAAFALTSTMGVSIDQMTKAVITFKGLPHRCQLVSKANDINWIDDSKATNVGACIAAITAMKQQTKGKLFLILSGLTKGVDLSPLLPVLKRSVDVLILLGEASKQYQALLPNQTHIYVQNMVEAVETAKQWASAGDTVLLSPAGASFDLFEDYAQRGEVFAQAVREHIAVE